MRARLWWVAIALAFALQENLAHAELILGTGFTTTWDRVANPSASPSVTLPISWSGSGDSQLWSYSLGLRITGGSGTLDLGTTIQIPASNPIFTAFYPTSPVVATPEPGMTTITMYNNNFADVSVPTTGANAFSFGFSSAGNDASGTYRVWAVPDYTSYYTTDFNQWNFSNVPAGNDVFLGTVTVTATPEPGTIALLITGGLMLLGWAWWRRRAPAA